MGDYEEDHLHPNHPLYRWVTPEAQHSLQKVVVKSYCLAAWRNAWGDTSSGCSSNNFFLSPSVLRKNKTPFAHN